MALNTATAHLVNPDTLIPDLFESHPETRTVFVRYGLRGCGGLRGPAESVRFFSRTHGVDEDRLLRELDEVIERGEPAPPQAVPGVADTIYRRFFTAGILVALTIGASWGAWLLWRIGVNGSFTSASIHEVNAHGHAQLFGWVGLFIMGFGYQAFPRMWQTTLVAPGLAAWNFAAMITGIAMRTAGMAATGASPWALPLVVVGGALEILASITFAVQIVATFRTSDVRWQPYLGFIFGAIVWFVLMSVFCLWHTWNTMTAGTREELLWFVSAYQAPLRDIQIHGFALFMILGVSIRMLPALFEVSPVPDRRAWSALAVITSAVVLECAFFLLFRYTDMHVWAGLMWVAWLFLAAGVAMVAWPMRLWRPLPHADRSGKFIRAAYAWLAVSLIMLVMLPGYQAVSGIPFSHAYYGAVRHAITVGFISMMIMGMAAKVVPTLNGIDTRNLGSLWTPFILVNLGCFLRVTTQTITDWNPTMFPFFGISGILEVTGLALWGIGLIAVMIRGKREMKAPLASTASARPSRIAREHIVAQVLDWFPQTEPVFLRHGFNAIRNPVMRRTVARQITLATAASMRGVNIESFLNDLNTVIAFDRDSGKSHA